MKRSEQREQIFECMGEFRNAVWANTLSTACFTLKVHPRFQQEAHHPRPHPLYTLAKTVTGLLHCNQARARLLISISWLMTHPFSLLLHWLFLSFLNTVVEKYNPLYNKLIRNCTTLTTAIVKKTKKNTLKLPHLRSYKTQTNVLSYYAWEILCLFNLWFFSLCAP